MPGKMPWYVHPHADPLIPSGLLLAGVWDRWHEPRGEGVLDTFAIVTTAVHPALAFIHDRQPVMLSPTEARHWVDPATPIDELDHLLGPQLPGTLALEPVSNRVNDARHKDPHCCDPVGPSRIIS
jgi:putative SOS response-associated peptidase YedK